MRLKNKEIFIHAARGEKEAEKLIWKIWSPKISVFLSNRMDIPYSEKEDLLQDIMEKIFSKIHIYNPLYSPATWVYTLAKNTVLDWKRKEANHLKYTNSGKDRSRGSEDADEILNFSGPFPDPETAAIQNEQLRLIRNFITSQSAEDRQILYLICHEGLSGRNTAKIMGRPASTVRDRIKQLKKQLEEKLS